MGLPRGIASATSTGRMEAPGGRSGAPVGRVHLRLTLQITDRVLA